MCILFLHVDPEPREGDYRLIVATNRDEYYRRLALDARKCDEDGSLVIGGKDMEPGREGGMWFGFSTKELENGKGKKHCISALLNITGEKAEHADGRGVLVTDYLKTSLDFPQYTEHLKAKTFNGYNLIAVELSKDEAKTFHHGNCPTIDSVYSGKQTLAFGNSPTYSPLKKVTEGRNMFEKIITKDLKNDELVEALLQLLKDESSHLPDVELEKRSPAAYNLLSSIFVKIGEEYGTRAHTILLIDYDWNLQFIEHAMEQPIDIKKPKWNVNKFQARL